MNIKRERKIFYAFFAIVLILNLNGLAFASNNTMTVQANILGFRNNFSQEGIGIQVPDFINIGDVTKENPVSVEFKVEINNTGTVNITVNPELSDSNEGIFSYLFFRTRKTSVDPNLTVFKKIGEYSLYIDKPLSGSSVRKNYCYMKLDLTNFNGPIQNDIIGHRTEVIFYAMPA
jgi:hypothetical protein